MKGGKRLRSLGRNSVVGYALSLPERIIRSASALSAGLVRETAEVSLPAALRRGRLYRNLVDATLKFMIERVGQVADAYPTEEALAEDFLTRRAVGNGLEVMGLLAFRVSPVWVLAALADVCGAGRQLIPDIAESLKQEGLLDEGEQFSNVDQLLAGLENTAGRMADAVNTPPLDIDSLREEWSKLAAGARELPAPKLPTRSSLFATWNELRDSAREQDRSIFEVSSLLAVSAVSSVPKRARLLSRSTALALDRTTVIVSQSLLDHYRATLSAIGQQGFVAYGIQQMTPYSRAALAMFSPTRKTLTERFVASQSVDEDAPVEDR
jgi:hypothetical protein